MINLPKEGGNEMVKSKLTVFLIFVAYMGVIASCNGKRTADLEAVTSAVDRYDSQAAKAISVPAGSHRKMYEGDGVNVDQNGYAKLDMGGCLLQIFRSSGLQVSGLPTESAPVCAAKFLNGTIYNSVENKMIVSTEWVVITTIGTEFLVHLDPDREIVWVIAVKDAVEVRAEGVTVQVEEGQQTWVWRGQPPEPPRPAGRDEIGDLFPPLEELTNGVLRDDELIPVTGDLPPEVKLDIDPREVFINEAVNIYTAATDERGMVGIEILIDGRTVIGCDGAFCEYKTEFGEPGDHLVEAIASDTSGQTTRTDKVVSVFPEEVHEISLLMSTDEVITGDCPGIRTLEVIAEVPPTIVPAYARLSYQWEGIEERYVEMERIDELTFMTILDSFDYCCMQTTIQILVEVFDSTEMIVATGRGEVLLTYCIG
jgi:hypothetical protein